MKMYIFFVSLLLPVFSSAQVKTREVEPPKKEEPTTKKQPTKSPTNPPREKPPYAHLLITTDLDVEIVVNFEKNYKISKAKGGRKISLELPTNMLKITPTDGESDGFTETLEVEKGEVKILNIEIGAERKAEAEGKRKEQERAAAARREDEARQKREQEMIATRQREEKERQRREQERLAAERERPRKALEIAESEKRAEEAKRQQFSSLYEKDMVLVKVAPSQGKDARDNVTANFYIGKYEVTQLQWKTLMGRNPSHFNDCDQCPVENVSWEDVQQFIKELNRRTGGHYRLPAEAEWEYAARGGTLSQGYKYAGSNDADEVAWTWKNAQFKTQIVGKKKPNELGLYDMSGNVWEWCEDQFSGTIVTVNSSDRIYKGGGWTHNPVSCKINVTSRQSPYEKSKSLGFRLACDP